MVAYLQAVREYNDAFRKNDPALRPEIVSILSKYTTVKDPALYDRMQLAGLDPDGEVNVESLRAGRVLAREQLPGRAHERRRPDRSLVRPVRAAAAGPVPVGHRGAPARNHGPVRPRDVGCLACGQG